MNRISTIKMWEGNVSSAPLDMIDVELDQWNIINGGDAYYQPIEKCQYIKKGMYNNYCPQVQPSVHCGVYPVDRLTTTNMSDVSDEYTDVQATWDVDVEIGIDFYIPNDYVSYQEPHHISGEDAYYTCAFDSSVTAKNTPCFQSNMSTFGNSYISFVKKKTK